MTISISYYNGVYAQKSQIPSPHKVINLSNNTSLINNSGAISNNISRDYLVSLPDLFDHVQKSVVQITDSQDINQAGGLGVSRLGSGFVYDNNGDIVTNYHVISGAKNNTIVVTFLDGVSYEAQVKDVDPYSDLAVIKLVNLDKHSDAISKLVPLQLANSSSLRVGQRVVAVGNPFGLSGTLTQGIISGLGRLMPTGNSDQFNPPNPTLNQYNTSIPQQTFSIPDIIQTDASINPGNSGGPLLNMKGQVVGINTAIFSDTGAYAGIGFAIPSNTLIKVLPTLIKGGTYKHSFIGVNGVDVTPEIAKILNLSKSTGYLVINVTKGGPADLAGIKGGNITHYIQGIPVILGGDVIIKIDNTPVRKVNDVLSYLENHKKVGDKVDITVIRNGHEKTLSLTLGLRPTINTTSPTSTPTLGIEGINLNPILASMMNITQSSGFLITGVLEQSPASKADLRGGYIIADINGRQLLLGGDIIVKMDNATIKNQLDIKKVLSTKKIGNSVKITILRDGKQLTKNVLLTNYTPNSFTLNNNHNNGNAPNQNPFNNMLPPSPSIPSPNQNFNDFLNSCYKIMDKSICNSLIPIP
jgi:S1-C subfamily serine protease